MVTFHLEVLSLVREHLVLDFSNCLVLRFPFAAFLHCLLKWAQSKMAGSNMAVMLTVELSLPGENIFRCKLLDYVNRPRGKNGSAKL